ncbi:MAG: light-harvesting antenna LH1, beta subunit [Pseudomonadota bacterium]
MADGRSTLTGLTHAEAQEFHSLFVQGFIGWIVICFIAHVLVWFWRPWFPGAEGSAAASQSSIMDNATQLSQYALQFLA